MDKTREKLLDLLQQGRETANKLCGEQDGCFKCPYQAPKGCVFGIIADHLIANGVTVQKWIPVTERLPSDDIPSAMYLCYWKSMIRVCKYWRTRKCFELRGKVVQVTHWMPLPEPPKE